MFKIKTYDLDNSYIYMSDMMKNNEPVFEYEFKQPNTEEEFDEIVSHIGHEGYLYELLKNNKPYADGIMTADSLYDDLMIGG